MIEPSFGQLSMQQKKADITCMKKPIFLLFSFCIFLMTSGVFAQNQLMVKVYIGPVEDGTEEEQEYFASNMRMELTGAAYEVVDTLEGSDFNLALSISRTEAEAEAPEETEEETPEASLPQINSVNLTLFDSKTSREIITLSWDYQQLSDMDMWNLYLITQAMSNAPIAKIPSDAASFAPPPTTATLPDLQTKMLWLGIETDMGYTYPNDGPFVGATFTVEFDFLPFMGVSAGFGYQALFPLVIDADEKQFYHSMRHNFVAPVMLKFFVNMESYLLIPSIGAEFNFGGLGLFEEESSIRGPDPVIYLPAVVAGMEFRVEAGPGVLDFGSHVIYDVDTNAWGVEFMVGFKFGLFSKN
jgi:hypothetical protein